MYERVITFFPAFVKLLLQSGFLTCTLSVMSILSITHQQDVKADTRSFQEEHTTVLVLFSQKTLFAVDMSSLICL